MIRELVIEIGGIRIYAETEAEKAALMKIIVANIRNAYTNKGTSND